MLSVDQQRDWWLNMYSEVKELTTLITIRQGEDFLMLSNQEKDSLKRCHLRSNQEKDSLKRCHLS